MQFIRVNHFPLPTTSRSASGGSSQVKPKRLDRIKITCCAYSVQTQSLICGLSDGTLLQFNNKKFSNKRLTESREFEVRDYDHVANPHKGEIKCILVEKVFNQVLLITGSADRTIRIWETDPKANDVIQTLYGHQGTVLCLVYSRKSDTIFSGSTDKSLRIWKQEQGRKFFMYPRYLPYQVIAGFSARKTQLNLYPTSLAIQDGELKNFLLLVGDSLGHLHMVREVLLDTGDLNKRPVYGYELDRSNYGYHRLTITAIVQVPKEQLVFSCSFDHQVMGFESLSNKQVLKYSNPHKRVFTSLVWYERMLVAADEQGSIYCIQIDKGVEQIKKYTTKILQMVAIPDRNDFLIVTEDSVDAVRIVKGIKAVEGENCHTGPIVGMFSLEADKLTEKKTKDQLKLVTVSLDYTMRVWDPADLSCLEMLPSPQRSQICSLFYLRRANLFVTGHENGAVRLWNIELQTSITISQENSPYAHTNNVCIFTEFIHVRNNDDITEYMLSAGYEGKINVWEIFIRKNPAQNSLMSSTICPQLKMSFSPDQMQELPDQIGSQLFALEVWQPAGQSDPTILSSGTKGEVYFTRMFTYETYRKVKVHNDTVNCMLIDGSILFTGSYDTTIKLTSLDNFQLLVCLAAHESAVTRLMLITETGHLISQQTEGSIFAWDYPHELVVKKIKEKKENILSLCYVNQLQLLYVGTQSAKIRSHSLKDLYEAPILKESWTRPKNDEEPPDYSQADIEALLKANTEQMNELLK